MDLHGTAGHYVTGLFPVLQMVSAQLGELMWEDAEALSKANKVGELSPVIRFELGPFEKADDNFYKDDHYVKAVNLKNKKMQEKILSFGDKKQHEKKKSANREIFNWKMYEENAALQKQKSPSEGIQVKRTHQTGSNSQTSEKTNFSNQITAIRNKIQKLKTLSPLMANLKSEIHKMEAALIIEPFENLLNVLEKSFSKRENTFYGINNITCNNRYQIENVFAINRLSKLKEIINDSSERKMSDAGISTATTGEILQQGDKELLNEFQKNFSRVFAHQKVSPQQIKEMSKIIDFVERFHGTVASSEDLKMASNVGMKGRKKAENVFTDEEFGFFEEEQKGREAIRRKGSVKH